MVDRTDKRKPVKLTRSEKKAMRRTEKLAVKLEKEQIVLNLTKYIHIGVLIFQYYIVDYLFLFF